MSILAEFWKFLRVRKRFWLLLLLMTAALGTGNQLDILGEIQYPHSQGRWTGSYIYQDSSAVL